MAPEFLYFDLGRVLINFDVRKMIAQIASVSGVAAERAAAAVFESGLQARYETGLIDSREFHRRFCRAVGVACDYQMLRQAACDIFELNTPVLAIAAQLRAAGCRMGILSNTCPAHWQHCRRHYASVIELFDVHALSYRLKTIKPQAAIFAAAAELAGVAAAEIFFVDDMPGHVEAAKAAGFDAVVYHNNRRLATELRDRGVAFNY